MSVSRDVGRKGQGANPESRFRSIGSKRARSGPSLAAGGADEAPAGSGFMVKSVRITIVFAATDEQAGFGSIADAIRALSV